MSKMERKKEIINNSNLGVFEETAPLKRVLMWGEPGAEAVLGQLLPEDISLFFSQFHVLQAREEFRTAVDILQNEGVEVIQVKDLFAEMIKEKVVYEDISISSVRDDIVARGLEFFERYKDILEVEDVEQVLSWIDDTLSDDVAKYGDQTASIINKALCLDFNLPLSNMLYARDQSNLMANVWVWSSMKKDIRQPEVSLYKKTLDWAGITTDQTLDVVEVGENCSTFEGGDGIINNGIAYIGVGGRTNKKGVELAAGSLLAKGIRVVVPIDMERDNGSIGEMDAMHLDTIWMPVSKTTAVSCLPEMQRRFAFEIVKNRDGLQWLDKGNFVDFLNQNGINPIPITKDEQNAFAPNFLNLGNNKVVLSLAASSKLNQELEKRGIKVYNANLHNITKGYGGLHCMTASIERA